MDALRKAINEAGGLHTQADLARRWSVTPAAVSDQVKHPDFPAPVEWVDGGRRKLWTGVETDEWRAGERRPGPRPLMRDATGKS